MQKYGRNIACESQICYSHAIHLAFIVVFYKKTSSVASNESDNDEEYFSERDDDPNDEDDSGDLTVNFENNNELLHYITTEFFPNNFVHP